MPSIALALAGAQVDLVHPPTTTNALTDKPVHSSNGQELVARTTKSLEEFPWMPLLLLGVWAYPEQDKAATPALKFITMFMEAVDLERMSQVSLW